jgi:hypothetical protein
MQVTLGELIRGFLSELWDVILIFVGVTWFAPTDISLPGLICAINTNPEFINIMIIAYSSTTTLTHVCRFSLFTNLT